ncbi:hypothetical protein Taro_017928, partial [Colocasia esculenta]|nr:hypothetical protein [Colocasia esculenta]
DYDALDFIGWEALVVDDCQNLVVSKHLEHLKKLSVDFSLILLNSQLKDNIADYLNLLSFLDSGSSRCSFDVIDASCITDTAELALLKNRLSKYIAHNRRVDCSKFLEYWIPIELSTVQLEQYCATLIAHSLSLRSFSKIDHVGVLRDIVVSQRKCCDHPYLVDEFLQAKLTKDLQAADYLDIGVKASGKLELLDRILQEMKDRGQRVVILFQVGPLIILLLCEYHATTTSPSLSTLTAAPSSSPSSPSVDLLGEPVVIESWEQLLGIQGESSGEGWDDATVFPFAIWDGAVGWVDDPFLFDCEEATVGASLIDC